MLFLKATSSSPPLHPPVFLGQQLEAENRALFNCSPILPEQCRLARGEISIPVFSPSLCCLPLLVQTSRDQPTSATLQPGPVDHPQSNFQLQPREILEPSRLPEPFQKPPLKQGGKELWWMNLSSLGFRKKIHLIGGTKIFSDGIFSSRGYFPMGDI